MILPDVLAILLFTAVGAHFIPQRWSKYFAIAGIVAAAFSIRPQGTMMWDPVGMVFSALFLALTNFIITFTRPERERISLFVAAAFALVGACGVSDLFSFYLFWEIACIASYFLAFGRESKDAALRYVISSIASSSFVFLAIALLYAETNSVEFGAIALLADKSVVVGLLLAGFGLRALIFPLNLWAPSVYSKTTAETSAFFAGVLNKIGIVAIIRMLDVAPEISGMLVPVSLVTIAVGNVFAFAQKDVKRLLAFSSMAHIGYAVLGLCIQTASALAGSMVYLVNHAVAMSLVFLSAEKESRIGEFSLSRTRRIGFIVGSLALAGMPGVRMLYGGFSLMSAVSGSFAIFLAASAIMQAIYYYRLISACGTQKNEEMRPVQKSVIIVLVLFVLLSGILPFTGEKIAGVLLG